MNEEPTTLRIGVSFGRKINLGNFQSADIFVSVSNIEVDASTQDIEQAMGTVDAAFSVVRRRVEEKASALLEQSRAAQPPRPTPPKPIRSTNV